jgi:hypothetical protein
MWRHEARIAPSRCSDCRSHADRRSFLQAGIAVGAMAFTGRSLHAAPTRRSGAEQLVAEFAASLSPAQREVICLPVDHAARLTVNANWHVTKPELGDDFYTDSQRDLADRIVRQLTSEDGYARLQKQMEDDSGGLQAYSVAIFGEPSVEDQPFQWLLTGRHLTLRADGDSYDRLAFGGPLIYGHGEESSPEANLFYYQTKQVNQVFRALDSQQQQQALCSGPPEETSVELRGAAGTFAGIPVRELSDDQRTLVADSIRVLLSPYRTEDVDEVMQAIELQGGLGSLQLAFYRDEDLEGDHIWDLWRIEGPEFVCHFRGAPHVHAYLHVGRA